MYIAYFLRHYYRACDVILRQMNVVSHPCGWDVMWDDLPTGTWSGPVHQLLLLHKNLHEDNITTQGGSVKGLSHENQHGEYGTRVDKKAYVDVV